MPNLLFIDTETGGLDPLKHSLLEIAMFAVCDNGATGNFNCAVIPEDGVYKVTHGALSVNKLDLRDAVYGTDAGSAYYDSLMFKSWLLQMSNQSLDLLLNPKSIKRYTVVGWNTPFDLGFIHAQFMDKDTWHQFVERRYIDLCSIAQGLALAGKIYPKNFALQTIAGYFDIYTGAAHIAKDDVQTTYQVYQRLMELLK